MSSMRAQHYFVIVENDAEEAQTTNDSTEEKPEPTVNEDSSADKEESEDKAEEHTEL